jgi:hypothetical protein
MTGHDELKQTIRRNKMLGLWAAKLLGKTGADAAAYSDALAVGTIDPEQNDVLSKLREDFRTAGVMQSDEQILKVMSEFMLKAGRQTQAGDVGDAAALALARKLTSR